MKVYFANMLGTKGLENYLFNKIDILAAFPSFPKKGVFKPDHCRSLFVDSGAFGKDSDKVNIHNYIQFLHQNKSQIGVYANLDIIGDAKLTYRNQKEMEKNGLNPIPVFHYASPIKYLKKYLKDGYSYISLGGMVPITTSQLQLWLDDLWENYLTDEKGFPKIKVHGFGLEIGSLLTRYPWDSIDASSVHMQARYGGIKTPWGWMKINPNVKADELKWQTPRKLKQVQSFVSGLDFDFSFKEAQEQSVEGTIKRCCISIRYFTKWMEENKVDRFVKRINSFF